MRALDRILIPLVPLHVCASTIESQWHLLLHHRPILRMKRIIVTIKFDHVLFSLREQRRILLSSTESRQWFPGLPRGGAPSHGGAMLRSVGFNATQGGRMALEICLGIYPRQIHLFSHHRGRRRRSRCAGRRRRNPLDSGIALPGRLSGVFFCFLKITINDIHGRIWTNGRSDSVCLNSSSRPFKSEEKVDGCGSCFSY